MSNIKIHLRRLGRAVLTALLATVVAACQGEPDDIWGAEPAGEPLLGDLGVPQRLTIAPSALGATGSFATARGQGRDLEADIDLAIVGGSMELWSPREDILFVRELEIELLDIVVPPEVMPPHGAYLTGVSARLASPRTVKVADDGARVSVITHLDLEASWSLVMGEAAYPLDNMTLREVPISIELTRNTLGEVQARLVGFRDGVFWSYAGAFALADLTMDLFARPEAE